MNAVRSKTAADLRRRKLQAMVIALVILLSSGTATLALSLLVESDAPYDHAFAQANGAHLTLRFAANRVSVAALRATASAHGVTAAAGPWLEVNTSLSSDAAQAGRFGKGSGPLGTFNVVGRDRPDTPRPAHRRERALGTGAGGDRALSAPGRRVGPRRRRPGDGRPLLAR